MVFHLPTFTTLKLSVSILKTVKNCNILLLLLKEDCGKIFFPLQTLSKNQPRFVQHHKRKVVHKRIFPWQDERHYTLNENNRIFKASL